jgi:phosphohistidine swiveling domain-containing protein
MKGINKKFKFQTKSETLKFLKKRVKKSKIENIFDFTVKNWNQDKMKILQKIPVKFNSKIIVRSSAEGEDSIEKSEAGSYESILNVNSNSKKDVQKAISMVIQSYKLQGNRNLQNQVLVQNQTTDVVTSGVVLTRESKRGLSYFIINFEDSDATDGVTKGKSNNTIKIFRKISILHIPEKWKNLVLAIREIEKIISIDYLDIEFGINKKNEVIIFQVRPITSIRNKLENQNEGITQKIINDVKKKFMSKQQSKNILGKKTFFSDMADWNPAEIIGNNPNSLDYSIYNYLIMRDSWKKGRHVIGYQKIKQKNLMIKFGNKPYVDIRKSFNSLIPENLENKKKLLNYYFDKFEKNPHLHDKVEFEILFTCYDFLIESRLKELLDYGFTKNDIKKLKESLLEFTNKIIDDYSNVLNQSNNSLIIMTKNREKILKKIKYESNYGKILNATQMLLDDCKNHGAIPFSTMARIAFISSILLKSFVKHNSIDSNWADTLMNSINTPLSRFREDYKKITKKKISKNDFLKEYGHLRPGTYDITARRYDDTNQFLSDVKFIETDNPQTEIFTNIKLDKIFQEHGLRIDQKDFITFIKNSLKQREELKFEFTRNLSEALELIAIAGKKLGFSRDELKDLEISDILSYKKFKKNDFKLFLKKKIIQQRKKKLINENLILPPIIFSKKDFEVIKSHIVKPNFITQKSVTNEIVYLDDLTSIPDLNHKIILIENADPGYDWIFTKNPAGLITKYGGIASHMAIRCAEISLPAAIGCGDIIFEKLTSSSKVILDCENNQITILENKIIDDYVEERKVLKSLGYIK